MFSRRTGWPLAANRLAAALEARKRTGREVLDLTISNPTRAGITYPSDEIAGALGEGSRRPYEPEPRGSARAREAIANWYRARGLAADPDQIVMTASTSEAYAWAFKLLCDPAERVLAPCPSYPLFEFLGTLESVSIQSYPLRWERRWEIDFGEIERLLAGPEDLEARAGSDCRGGPARAIVVVSPNNPTGSYLSAAEADRLETMADRHRLVIIADEVFSTYPIGEDPSARSSGARASPELVPSLLSRPQLPALVLDGLSKSAGMPGIKAGWIVVSGPSEFRDAALARLEVIADTYLSIGSPVQNAIPELIALGRGIAAQIGDRIRANHSRAHAAFAGSACDALLVEGGWSAVLRVPRTLSEEDWAVRLLEEDAVLVQPGWFFDFETEAFLVVSLLSPESAFAEGLARIRRRTG